MISFFWEENVASGATVTLGGEAADHARVRRVAAGEEARLLDGRGRVASGRIVVAKREVRVEIARVETLPRPLALEAMVPVADRDRMLWAAEKCVELDVTAWRPVLFARSRSVTPRGEGERFAAKVRLRMQSALEQSGGAWLPDLYEEVDPADAWSKAPSARRLILDAGGAPIRKCVFSGPAAFAVGPEGGFEKSEFESAIDRGWVAASLGPGTLRFETAVVAGAAVIRATQL